MLHSIIGFYDEKGILIDFHRLKQKKPETVLKAVFKGFSEFEGLYITEDLKHRCRSVNIHYTEYECTEENKTFECSFDDFLQRYQAFKMEKSTSRETLKDLTNVDDKIIAAQQIGSIQKDNSSVFIERDER